MRVNSKTYSVKDLLAELRQLAPLAQLRSDSRAVQMGDIFFAYPIPGSGGDGRQFIADAIARGAAAVVYEMQDFDDSSITAPQFAVVNLIQELGVIAHAWYQRVDSDIFGIAVTGTNGKTSCSQWIAKALSLNDKACAVIGTLGVGTYKDGILAHLEETGFTTPDALRLQTYLATLPAQAVTALAIEASSIGLHQGRLNGLAIDVALFTNFSRDHLDYHGSLAEYARAKEMLFSRSVCSSKLKAAVLNLDDVMGVELARNLKRDRPELTVLGYGIVGDSDGVSLAEVPTLLASQLRTTHAGTSFFVDSPYGTGLIKTQMIGRFNVSNVLGVLGVLLQSGVTWDAAVTTLEKLQSVPGRMQQLGSNGQAMVVVDYAHTPDALEKTLETLQLLAKERQGELWCVF
ncbi:MAG: UDP-N-acetylmuramoyl-L-alanyl-D-glutamate--2,6-diaminopimelate ligase, partial [Undibacterium sp.]|nr:UDP-N-acetylmuramoyl-L-alanyl-D-glutamate--2,6-diaminopimelate ligase [Undibacterium sp.]